MTIELTPSEAKALIGDQLAGTGAENHWNGAAPDVVNEYVIIAQRHGVDAAVDAILDYVDDED